MKLPTDLELLNEIYEEYYPAFIKLDPKKPVRDSKIYVPIDTDLIGKRLGVDGDIIFGRLYYHFNNKYNYEMVAHQLIFCLKTGKGYSLGSVPIHGIDSC